MLPIISSYIHSNTEFLIPVEKEYAARCKENVKNDPTLERRIWVARAIAAIGITILVSPLIMMLPAVPLVIVAAATIIGAFVGVSLLDAKTNYWRDQVAKVMVQVKLEKPKNKLMIDCQKDLEDFKVEQRKELKVFQAKQKSTERDSAKRKIAIAKFKQNQKEAFKKKAAQLQKYVDDAEKEYQQNLNVFIFGPKKWEPNLADLDTIQDGIFN